MKKEKTENIRTKEEPGKVTFKKPGNFLYPVPAVMVSCAPKGYDPEHPDEEKKPNIITVAWAGTVCSDPPMVSISVRKERHSYRLLKESGEFVINLTNRALARACDYCGCTSGAKIDKFKECRLTPGKSTMISAPTVEEAPVSLECRVTQVIPLGSHDMFLAEILAVQVGEQYLDERGAFHMEDTDLIAYSHGKYYALGKLLGSFGFSVKKTRKSRTPRRKISGNKA